MPSDTYFTPPLSPDRAGSPNHLRRIAMMSSMVTLSMSAIPASSSQPRSRSRPSARSFRPECAFEISEIIGDVGVEPVGSCAICHMADVESAAGASFPANCLPWLGDRS